PPGRAAPPPPRHGGLPWLPGEARPLLELPPERLDLVPQVGRVLAAALLCGLDQVLLERDDLALGGVRAPARGDRRLRPSAAPARGGVAGPGRGGRGTRRCQRRP